ncbi:hypothetical protein [Actinoplanes sp. NPDC051851]|uniref:hypothetical protein n=1 Tax=Actinoplanes sp. NPDC051851 TaxID=3154753 RepID=UPI003424BFF6
MSSGGIVVMPAGAVLSAGAAVVLTAAAAAALTVWAANQAAEAALRGLGNLGESLERTAEAQAAAAIAALRWPRVAAEVVELNARLRLLTERASRAGVAVAIPEPLVLAGRTEQEAATWAARAAPLLRAAAEAVAAGCAATESERLAAGLPESIRSAPGTAAALSRLQQTLRDRHRTAAPAPAPARPAAPAPDLDGILRTLDEDATEQERLTVLRTAALAGGAAPAEARAYVRQLRSRVAELNGRAERRRLAATLVTALEEPVVVRTPPPGPYGGTAARLRAVIGGQADLTEELLTEASGALRWAETVIRAAYVRETVSACLAEQGYTVDAGDPAELRLSHADWHGEHSAAVWVDTAGTVHGRLEREEDVDGDEAAGRDRERCDTFTADLAVLAGRLDAEVVVDPRHTPQRRARTAPVTVPVQRPKAREVR